MTIIFTVFRIVMELGTTVWKDRIRRTEDPNGDIYIGGWRKGEENGWGQETTKKYVGHFFIKILRENICITF